MPPYRHENDSICHSKVDIYGWIRFKFIAQLVSVFFFKASFDLLVIALLDFIMILSTHSEVEARPTGCVTHPFNNLKGTSSSRNTTQATRSKTGRIAENQREMLTADASGIATTSVPRTVNENICIKRYRYRIICNDFFVILVCKKHQGCYEVKKIVSFGKGRTYAITFKC